MSDVYSQGRFSADAWRMLSADDARVAGERVILPKARFLDEIEVIDPDQPLGVKLEAGDAAEDIATHLDRVQLVAVNFPKFSDGRGFSIARLLRERHGFTGAIRAVGDVLLDLLPLMERVGFSEYVVTHEPSRQALLAGHIPAMTKFYQPAWSGDTAETALPVGRPWLRRAI